MSDSRRAAGPSTIVFAGGGTGGHLFPGIAVAQALQLMERPPRCVFVGSTRSLEDEIVRDNGYEHRSLAMQSSRALWRRPVRFLYEMRRAIRAADRLLKECRPDVVVGLGAFASAPVVFAARAAQIPVVLLEQNAVPGRATSWLARQAKVICLGMPEARRYFAKTAPCVVTGNPLRVQMTELGDEVTDRRTLLVLGGSQGSSALNGALLSCVERLPEAFAGWHVIHQSGPRDAEGIRERYAALGIDAEVAPFFTNLAARYRRAEAAVCRAGALTLSELAHAGVPAVVLPHPRAIRNHQWKNACAFEHAGAARIARERRDASRTSRELESQLLPVLSSGETRSRMSRAMKTLARPDAASRVAEQILALFPRKENRLVAFGPSNGDQAPTSSA